MKAGILAAGLILLMASADAAERRRGVPAVASITPAAMQEQPSQPQMAPLSLTLEEAIALALANNLGLRGALVERTAQKFDLYVAESKFDPVASLSVGAKMRQARPYSENGGKARNLTFDGGPEATVLTPIGTNFSLRWSHAHTRDQVWPKQERVTEQYGSNPVFTIRQPLLQGFGLDVNQASVRIARISETMAVLGLRDRTANLITLVINGARSVLQSQMQMEVAERALERAREQVEIGRAMIQAGRMAALDLVQTEAAVAQREFDVSTAENRLRAAELSLLSLMGIKEKPRIQIAESLDAQRIVVPFEPALKTALGNRPDYLSSKLSIESGRDSLLMAEDSARWKLDAEGSLATGTGMRSTYGHSNGAALGMGHSDYAVGVRLTVPLTDLAQRQTLTRARTSLQRAELAAEELRNTVEIDVMGALRDVNSTWREIELARQSEELAERKLQIEREKLTTGRSTPFQVNQFESDVVAAQRARINASIAYLNAIASLDRVLGTTLDTWNIDLHDDEVLMREPGVNAR